MFALFLFAVFFVEVLFCIFLILFTCVRVFFCVFIVFVLPLCSLVLLFFSIVVVYFAVLTFVLPFFFFAFFGPTRKGTWRLLPFEGQTCFCWITKWFGQLWYDGLFRLCCRMCESGWYLIACLVMYSLILSTWAYAKYTFKRIPHEHMSNDIMYCERHALSPWYFLQVGCIWACARKVVWDTKAFASMCILLLGNV